MSKYYCFMNKISIPTNGLKYLDDMTEKNLAEITIHDVDPLALTLLVNFSYTGELSVCEDNVQVFKQTVGWVKRILSMNAV